MMLEVRLPAHVAVPLAWVGGVFLGLGLARFRQWLRTKRL